MISDVVVYLDFKAMTATPIGGKSLPIVKMLNARGDEVTNNDDANCVIAGSDEDGWLTIHADGKVEAANRRPN